MKLFTVGPTEMPVAVRAVRAGADSVPYFRTAEFSQLMLETDEWLRELAHAGEGARTIYLTASGTAAMEAAVMNVLTPNDRVLIINGGTFGRRFVDICEIHGIAYDEVRVAPGETLSPEHLAPFAAVDYAALLVNIDETSTGQLYDTTMLADFCQRKNMYFIVDAISSFLADQLDMVASGFDVLIISSQKGPCISPGLAMVILSARIIAERVEKNNIRSLYFDFKEYLKNFTRGQTPYTPAVGICIELHTALECIVKRGLARHLADVAALAADFRARLSALPVTIPSYPLSNAVTPVVFSEPIAHRVFEILKDEYAIFVNPTGGATADTVLRVAHIGELTIDDNAHLVECMERAIAQARNEMRENG